MLALIILWCTFVSPICVFMIERERKKALNLMIQFEEGQNVNQK